jgi:hypothetical protein
MATGVEMNSELKNLTAFHEWLTIRLETAISRQNNAVAAAYSDVLKELEFRFPQVKEAE